MSAARPCGFLQPTVTPRGCLEAPAAEPWPAPRTGLLGSRRAGRWCLQPLAARPSALRRPQGPHAGQEGAAGRAGPHCWPQTGRPKPLPSPSASRGTEGAEADTELHRAVAACRVCLSSSFTAALRHSYTLPPHRERKESDSGSLGRQGVTARAPCCHRGWPGAPRADAPCLHWPGADGMPGHRAGPHSRDRLGPERGGTGVGSVPQTLVGTAPWVPGAGTAQVRNAPSHEAGALKAQCAGERTGSPSKPSAQRPL